jgi:hypothetical protein
MNNIKLLYFNLSDLIYLNDDSISRFDSIEVYEHVDRFSGFFYNLKNITKSEVENFLIFYGANLQMINDIKFINNLIFFLSLFYNQAILYFFMLQITILELYMLLNNDINKQTLQLIMLIFNKRLILEIYRFYLTFVNLYNFVDFKKFKVYVLSNSFLFDSHFLYHYYYFIDYSVEGYNLKYRLYTHFLENVFMKRLSFFEIIKLLCDSLIINLTNLLYINKNYLFTLNLFNSKYKFLNIFKNNKLNNCYNNYIQHILNFFKYLHEIFVFFRYHLYNVYLILLYNKKKFLLYYIKLFKLQFFNLLKFFYNLIYFNNILLNICLFFFNEIKIYIYKCFLKNSKKVFLYNYYISFQFFFYKIFNVCKYYFYNKSLLNSLNIYDIYIKYNLYVYNFLKKNNINVFFYDFFFQYNTINNNINNKNYLFEIYLNNKINFNFKLNYFIYNNIVQSKIIFNISDFFKNFLTKRTLNIYYNYIIGHNKSFSVNFYNYIDIIKNKFNIKYHSFINLYINFSLYNVILQLHEVYKYYLYLPIFFRIKSEIEDFFFLLSEEIFIEDYTYFIDDILMDIEEESELNDPEDDGEFLDNFFDEYESSHLPFLLFVEEIVSINYYIYNYINYKYMDIIYPSIEKLNFNISWEYDFLYSKVSPFFIKKYLLYGGEYFFEYINADMWYNWINYILLTDLYAFDINYYNVSPQLKFLTKNFRNFDLNRVLFGYKNLGIYDKNYSFFIKNKDLIDFDKSYNEFFSDILHFEFANENNNLNYLVYEVDIETADNSIIDCGDIEGINSLNSDDDRLLSVYSSYSDFNFYNLLVHYLDKEDENVKETFFRDFVSLNEIWVWWEYINKIYRKDLSNQFLNIIKPKNFNDLLFLVNYNLSGLSYVISLILQKSKTEKINRLNILDEIKDFIESNIDVALDKKNFLKIFSDFEYYYLNWLNIYNWFIFINDYNDLVTNCFIYEKIIHECFLKEMENENNSNIFKKISNQIQSKKFSFSYTNSYYFLRRQEKIFFSMLNNVFSNFLGSFYFYKNKSNLEVFWEHFFLVCIEIIYSFMDLHTVNDFNYSDIGDIYYYGDFLFMPERQILPFAIDELYKINVDDFSLTNVQIYLSDLLKDVMDPYILIYNGLNINVSLAESLFFDLYETYMQYYADVDHTEYDEVGLTRFKFFEFDENDIRYGDENDIFANQQVEQYYNSIESFLFSEELVAQKSIGFNNFYIGESYDLYLKRYYSVYKKNFFLFGLLNSYVNLFFKSLNTFKDVRFINSYSYFNDNYILWYDIKFIKFEFIYYYFLQIFFLRLKKYIYIRHLFIILIIYFFLSKLKYLKLTIKFKIFILFLFIKYFIYIYYFLIKNNFKLYNNINYNNFLQYLNNISQQDFNIFILKLYFKLNYLYNIIYNIQYSYINIKILKKKFNFILSKKICIYIYIFYKNIIFFKQNINLISNNISYLKTINNYYYRFLNKTTLRSYFSTYFIYNDNILMDNYILDYFFNVSNNLIKKYKKYDNNNIFKNDILLFDNYDFIKDTFYHDYEDYLDDEDFYTDEWTGDLILGDLTDDYEEDTYDDNAGLDYNEEEFNYEFDLDKSLYILYESNFNFNYNNNYNYMINKFYRFNFFFKNLYYYNLNIFRLLIINLFKYYKIKVPVTRGFDLEQKFLYYNNIRDKVDFTAYEFYDFAEMTNLRKDLFTNIRRSLYNEYGYDLIKNYKNNLLIPKYIYSYQLSDILDYFIDFNNIEISEYNQSYDIYNVINGINFSHNDLIKFNNFSDYFNKLLYFFKYVLLYIKIYKYISNDYNSKKMIFFSFFFFELLFLYKRIIYFLYKKYFFLFKTGVYLNYKYIFNKVYNYVYKMLINYNSYLFHNNFLHKFTNFFIFIPFFKYNYYILLNKVQLLFFLLKKKLSIFSCFLFIKIFEYILILDLSKDFLLKIFLRLKNLFLKYEYLINYNSYKIANIYAKYGIQESFFFFNNIVLTDLINYKIEFYKIYYKRIYQLFYIIEFLYFILWSFIFLLFIIKINLNIFLTSFGSMYDEPAMEGDAKHMIFFLARNIFDYKLFYYLNDTWIDFWGLF